MTEKAAFWQNSKVQIPTDDEGRKRLFLRLAKENEELLVRCARRLCNGDRDRAADCVQEAIISAYKAFDSGKFTDVHNFKPWILRILTNAFLLDERKRKRMIVTNEVCDIIEGRQNPTEAEPESLLLDQGYSEEIECGFRSLGADQLACITLVDIEGMDYAEAAMALEVPIGTVRSRLARARLKMANEIVRFRGEAQFS